MDRVSPYGGKLLSLGASSLFLALFGLFLKLPLLWVAAPCLWGWGAIPLAACIFPEVSSKRLWYLCLVFLTAVSAGAMLNVQTLLTDGVPLWSDTGQALERASEVRQGLPVKPGSIAGYHRLLALIVLEPPYTFLIPMMLSVLAALGFALCTGWICSRLLPELSRGKAIFWGTLLCMVVPSVPYYGTMVMKETPLCLAWALMCVPLVQGATGKLTAGGLVCGALGTPALGVLKASMALPLVLGVAVVLVMGRKKNRNINALLFTLLLCTVIIGIGREVRVQPATDMIQPQNAGALSEDMLDYATVQPYARLIPGYFHLPVWHRMLYLPLTATAQYLPPFPWNFLRDADTGPTVLWAHMAPLWYTIGGMAIGWLVLRGWRKDTRRSPLGLWGFWTLLCWCGIAVASGGSVARYTLPLLTGIVPMALQTATAVCRKQVSCKTIGIYGGVYSFLLISALTAAYILIH